MPIAPLTNDSKSNLLAKIAANTGETKPAVGDGEHNLLWKIAANTYATATTGGGGGGGTGATGATGPSGSAGANGATGEQGATGEAGATGETGATGSGATGATGTAGSQGATGEQGATGLTGATGVSPDTSSFVQKSGDTMTGKLVAAADATSSKLNIGAALAGGAPSTIADGDVWISNQNRFAWRTGGNTIVAAGLSQQNTFSQPQSIGSTSNAAPVLTASNTGSREVATFTNTISATSDAVVITNLGSGNSLVVNDDTTPDSTRFAVSNTGRVGVGVTPDAAVALSVDTTGIKFGDGTIQTTAMLAGATGATGAGATGATGVAGSDGATGSTGATGTAGVDGATGLTGATGEVGATGEAGATGLQGATGLDGSTGATGPLPWNLPATVYDNGFSYNIGDAVTYQGGYYYRTGNPLNPGYPPTPGSINASWTPVADGGATGVQGATGETGATGDVGATGLQGATGEVGATGLEGATGLTGDAGATGEVGATGIQGATGDIGATGDVGATGETGATGEVGATGSFGEPGPQGATGATGVGETGATGEIGATGDIGATGVQGATGEIGSTGVTGDIGATGDFGATGATGIGATGEVGATGLSGATGLTGATGEAGATGASGATGATGDIGASGFTTIYSEVPPASPIEGMRWVNTTTMVEYQYYDSQWVEVTSVATGATGATGPQGATGSGATGEIGATGVQGATGADGATGLTGATGVGATGATGVISSTPTFDYIEFDSTYTSGVAQYQVAWNDTDGTIELGLKGGNIDLAIGQENVILVKNDEATALSAGEVVYISGANGVNLLVKRAQANADATSARTIGVVAETIAINGQGFVCTFGAVKNIDTNAFNNGDILYLSPTVAGGITNVKPSAPSHLVLVGFCQKKAAGAGQIFVEVQNGYELEELHNVQINSGTLLNNNLLAYNLATDTWQNKTLSDVNAVGSNISGLTGATQLTNLVQITQAGYNAIVTPDANTLYVIVG